MLLNLAIKTREYLHNWMPVPAPRREERHARIQINITYVAGVLLLLLLLQRSRDRQEKREEACVIEVPGWSWEEKRHMLVMRG